MEFKGYVSEAGWIGFLTNYSSNVVPYSGNIISYYYDYANSLLQVLFGGPTNFTFVYVEGEEDELLGDQINEFLIKKLGNGNYEMAINSDRAGSGLISIYSVSGQQVVTRNIHLIPGANRYSIDLSQFADGLYLISLSTNQKQFSAKLLHKN